MVPAGCDKIVQLASTISTTTICTHAYGTGRLHYFVVSHNRPVDWPSSPPPLPVTWRHILWHCSHWWRHDTREQHKSRDTSPTAWEHALRMPSPSDRGQPEKQMEDGARCKHPKDRKTTSLGQWVQVLGAEAFWTPSNSTQSLWPLAASQGRRSRPKDGDPMPDAQAVIRLRMRPTAWHRQLSFPSIFAWHIWHSWHSERISIAWLLRHNSIIC